MWRTLRIGRRAVRGIATAIVVLAALIAAAVSVEAQQLRQRDGAPPSSQPQPRVVAPLPQLLRAPTLATPPATRRVKTQIVPALKPTAAPVGQTADRAQGIIAVAFDRFDRWRRDLSLERAFTAALPMQLRKLAKRHPAVAIGLGTLVLVPLLLLVGFILSRIDRARSAVLEADAASAPSTSAPCSYGHAWLCVASPNAASAPRVPAHIEDAARPGASRRSAKASPPSARGEPAVLPLRLPLRAELVKIGRDEENDLRLAHDTVHRHHALLHRNADAEFTITDLSGRHGNGLRINGARVRRAVLRSGDQIDVGAVRLQFDAA